MATQKKVPPNPVTTGDADAFAMFMHKWQSELNLQDWRIERSTKSAGKANMAAINRISLPDRLATFAIGADFGARPVTAQSVEEIACHETCHVFLHEYKETCRDSSSTDEDIMAAEHRLVNTLVRLLVPEAR
jgi:hypothetical protein